MSFASGPGFTDTSTRLFFRSMKDRIQEVEDHPNKEKTKIDVSRNHQEKNPLKRLQNVQKMKRGE
jgi:hypothetical protein